MSKVISICNQKGGVAKTSNTKDLAVILSRGKRSIVKI